MDAKCKKCRRSGEKLFLKGERCFTPKCAMVRKPYPPGIHGTGQMHRRRRSEYGRQLIEKQKVRFLYGISESQFSKYVHSAMADKSKDVATVLAKLLEQRLDNVLFRLGFAISRSIARQMISHGHILVDDRVVTIPSRIMHIGNTIKLHTKTLDSGLTKHLDTLLKKYEVPAWLELDKKKKIGKVVSSPLIDEFVTTYNMKSIIEYYSR